LSIVNIKDSEVSQLRSGRPVGLGGADRRAVDGHPADSHIVPKPLANLKEFWPTTGIARMKI
jgi:hypothetical protein